MRVVLLCALGFVALHGIAMRCVEDDTPVLIIACMARVWVRMRLHKLRRWWCFSS